MNDNVEKTEGLAGEIVLYQPDDSITMEVRIDASHDTVWLNRQQMAELFERDVKTIGKHINNALQEELAVDSVGAKNATTQSRKNPTIANFATVQREGNRTVTRQIEYYNLDVILSVGYRVKSNRGIQFRRWANQVLKQHLLNGYSINRHLVALQQQMDSRFEALEQKVDEQQQQVEFLVDMHRQPEDRLFPTGCVFDAWEYVAALVRKAKNGIVLIDNYCDERTLMLLSKRQPNVECIIYTRFNEAFDADVEKHNKQYPAIKKIQLPQKEHDRFLIIDDTVYILGDSLKNLGHSLTTVLKTSFTAEEILEKIRN
ncbi:MAG: virulence RhuM family protein [Paludibacteraceae bacterium]|nr:virulence RhuM family protein [Paludibacteraceae bacterium]